jgi:hypothetical protein
MSHTEEEVEVFQMVQYWMLSRLSLQAELLVATQWQHCGNTVGI